jgi:putative ABC transport system permease protein
VQEVGLHLPIPPVVEGKPITARVPGYETDTINVAGISPNMTEIAPRDLDFGRYFSAEEDQRGAHVAVIGNNVADSLFPSGNAVSRTMMMDGAEYIVGGTEYIVARPRIRFHHGSDAWGVSRSFAEPYTTLSD